MYGACRISDGDGGARLGAFRPGGLTVFGLCFDCNNLTSGIADTAYIDFYRDVGRFRRPGMRRLLLEPTAKPATVAPGSVAHSLLCGKFALNDRLQEQFPALAESHRDDDRERRLPDELSLRLALIEGAHARIGGPVAFLRVLGTREAHAPFADIWFPPLAWCLVSSRSGQASLGAETTTNWADVSDWIRYRNETTLDLRVLVQRMQFALAPPIRRRRVGHMLSDSMAAIEGLLDP